MEPILKSIIVLQVRDFDFFTYLGSLMVIADKLENKAMNKE